ncbi:hypothetical protein HHI36_006462, partial [Cryptolaemus montrouzieri]
SPLKSFVSNNCPIVKVPVDERRPVKLWLNEEIKDLMKKRDRSYQIAVFIKSDQKWMKYRTLRNQNNQSHDLWKNIKYLTRITTLQELKKIVKSLKTTGRTEVQQVF